MTYLHLTYFHLGTVVPAFFLGMYLLINTKGTPLHKLVGKSYMILMLLTALITLLMSAEVGPTVLGHFGFIHLFSFLVLYSVPAAYFAARSGDTKSHKGHMLGVFIGGILIAGAFAFTPGRLLHLWLMG